MSSEEIPPPKTHSYPLGFAIVGTLVVHNKGGTRPATQQEIILWEWTKTLEGEIQMAKLREASKTDAALR